MFDVAAIFVDPLGPYPKISGVDWWGTERDARLYADAYPVVAHPPCNRWISFAYLNFARWGGEHNRPGNDGGCFASALANVRRVGGVLEHPAESRAFYAHGLPTPWGGAWQRSLFNQREWVCEVWQSAYGHRARKRTWLFYCGTTVPEDADWSRENGTHQVGYGWDQRRPALSKREAAETPILFAEYLVGLAKGSR